MKKNATGNEVVLRLTARCEGEYFHLNGHFLLSRIGEENGLRHLENITGRSNSLSYDFEDLLLSSQGNSTDEREKRELYAWRCGYRNKDLQQVSELAWMAKTFRRLEKSLAEQSAELGPTRRFSEYIARVCRALGIKTVVVQVRDGGWSYSLSEWRYMPVGEGVDWAFRKEEEWRETGTVKMVD